jgi:hypothetical protein
MVVSLRLYKFQYSQAGVIHRFLNLKASCTLAFLFWLDHFLVNVFVTLTNPAFSIFYCVCWPNKWLWAAIYNFFLLCWWCCVLVPMHWWCISVRRNRKAGLTAASLEGRPAKTLRSFSSSSLALSFWDGSSMMWFGERFFSSFDDSSCHSFHGCLLKTLLFCLEGLLFSSGLLVLWLLFLLYSKLKKEYDCTRFANNCYASNSSRVS